MVYPGVPGNIFHILYINGKKPVVRDFVCVYALYLGGVNIKEGIKEDDSKSRKAFRMIHIFLVYEM